MGVGRGAGRWNGVLPGCAGERRATRAEEEIVAARSPAIRTGLRSDPRAAPGSPAPSRSVRTVAEYGTVTWYRLPAVAAALAGWILAGRTPPATRQPID